MHCPTLVLVEVKEDPVAIRAEADRILSPSWVLSGRPGELPRYDFHAIGGRFAEWLGGEDSCSVRRLPPGVVDRIRHLVEPNGVWHDRYPDWCWPWPLPEMRAPASWRAEATEVLSAHPEALAVMVDLHH